MKEFVLSNLNISLQTSTQPLFIPAHSCPFLPIPSCIVHHQSFGIDVPILFIVDRVKSKDKEDPIRNCENNLLFFNPFLCEYLERVKLRLFSVQERKRSLFNTYIIIISLEVILTSSTTSSNSSSVN